MDSESTMSRFHSIYEKLNRILAKTPFDELRISVEVKEEVKILFTSSCQIMIYCLQKLSFLGTIVRVPFGDVRTLVQSSLKI